MKLIVTIHLKHSSNVINNYLSPYYHSNGKEDKVYFKTNEIVIEAERPKQYSLDDILYNLQNSIYNQIYKTLLFHYCVNGSNSEISSLEIVQNFKGKIVSIGEMNFDNNHQPFAVVDPPISFSPNSLKSLFAEDDKAYRLRIITNHWLFAFGENDILKKLEGIWRTFERLCDYLLKQPLGSKTNNNNALKKMIEELTTNSSRYVHTSNLVAGMTYDQLRQFRWHDMIENDYKEIPDLSNCDKYRDKYRDYVNKLSYFYHDKRVAQLNIDLLPYRKEELSSLGFLSSLIADNNSKISSNCEKDIDIVALLCCNYVYFLRNKIFHGETVVRHSIFDFHNTDDLKLNEIIDILTCLTIELINHYDDL